ncbi:MAG: SMC-Scp complex subunit ScpB [Planctomycetia bacterium]|nr:SMC-Scp complex subunit ScpB [Planctomycetia bacterium]
MHNDSPTPRKAPSAAQAPADDDDVALASAETSSASVSPSAILEAMLFVGHPAGDPLLPEQAAGLIRGVRPKEIEALVGELNARYAAANCPYHVVRQQGGYRLELKPEFGPLRNRFHLRARRARLSQAAVDVLSLVAYRQPVTADEVGRLRGFPSAAILAQLVRRGLLRVDRPPTKPRRTRYHTTDRFLKLLELESLDDLPHGQETEPGP